MSYLNTIEYKIIPLHSYKIIRNCSGCGCKSSYINTEDFRVNANGNKIDVWMIYQCEKCKHTYNLTIYERKSPTEIERKEYQRLLGNDKELALQYGMDKSLFARNKAQIDRENMEYYLLCKEQKNVDVAEIEKGNLKLQIQIDNPYELKIRMDKLVSEILEISRSKGKKLLDEKKVKISIS